MIAFDNALYDNNGRTQSVTNPWGIVTITTTATTANVTQNVIRFDFPETATSNYILIDPELLKKPDPYWAWVPYAPVAAWKSQTRLLGAPHGGVRARRRILSFETIRLVMRRRRR